LVKIGESCILLTAAALTYGSLTNEVDKCKAKPENYEQKRIGKCLLLPVLKE